MPWAGPAQNTGPQRRQDKPSIGQAEHNISFVPAARPQPSLRLALRSGPTNRAGIHRAPGHHHRGTTTEHGRVCLGPGTLSFPWDPWRANSCPCRPKPMKAPLIPQQVQGLRFLLLWRCRVARLSPSGPGAAGPGLAGRWSPTGQVAKSDSLASPRAMQTPSSPLTAVPNKGVSCGPGLPQCLAPALPVGLPITKTLEQSSGPVVTPRPQGTGSLRPMPGERPGPALVTVAVGSRHHPAALRRAAQGQERTHS